MANNPKMAHCSADEIAQELKERIDQTPQAITFGGGSGGPLTGLFGGGVLKGLFASIITQFFGNLDPAKLADAASLAFKLWWQGKTWQEILDAVWAFLTTP